MKTVNRNLAKRQYVVIGIFVVIGVVYLLKLFSLQVLDKSLKQSADNNVLRFVTQYPARGKVFDRNGELLVYNEAVYDLMVVPGQVKDIDTLEFCRLLGLEPEVFTERLVKARKYSRVKASIFMSQIPKEDYAHIGEILYRYPGFYFQTRTLRHYPMAIAAHTLGDIGEVDQAQLEHDPYYKMGDYVGKSGIEKYYEKELRGKKGLKVIMVDVHNREKGSYLDGLLDTLPSPGKDLYLGLDAELQAYGEKLMHGKIGSIVAIEPKTGQILAFVSSPSYDPNLLVGRARGANFAALLNDPDKPLINRAVSGTYPPGSTFKMVNGLIALQSGSITPATRFHCNGPGTTPIKCTHHHGGSPDLANAIENSCNPYFYEAFKTTINNPKFGNIKKGFEYWRDMTWKLGLGHKFDTDIPSELAGNIPTREFYDKIYRGSWNSVTIRSLGIGQGEILLTPLQLANIAATIANEGYYYPPHLIRAFGDSTAIPEKMTTRLETGIERRHFKVIKAGMQSVFEGSHGTARSSKIPGITAGGKTGTAQNPHGDNHSIFIAFAPVEDPQIALSIIIENGGYGSTWAAPIASLMMEKYIRGSTERPAVEKRMMDGVINYSRKKK
ncbi:MAG: penicillin-binding protein 2 [Bacteroidales bacterium]|nr:penicillin-binding protein 2 [Bacteroidales bacterium]